MLKCENIYQNYQTLYSALSLVAGCRQNCRLLFILRRLQKRKKK